jgi:two-component system cell cycle response regulator DivK
MVLMDIQLPGCDGYVLLDEIRSSPYRGLPVVALTAHAMAGDKERATAAGFDGYITKPIDVRGFPAQIANILSHKAGTEIA